MRCLVLVFACCTHALSVHARAWGLSAAPVVRNTAEIAAVIPPPIKEVDFAAIDDCAVIDPDALNLLACHFIAHHRPALVEFINDCAFTQTTYDAVDTCIGDLISLRKLRFDITGPLEPQNYFRCYEVNVIRDSTRSDLVYADLTVEYRNQLTVTLDALRHVGAVRGNSTLANAYRWATTPIRGQSPLRAKLTGHGEGATKLRLTLQATQGVAFPRLAHVQITDASGMRVVLEDYSLSYLGPTGALARLVVGQLPLKPLEGIVNDAIQCVFKTYRQGWPVMGGVVRERTGSWSRLGSRLGEALRAEKRKRR